MYFMIVQERKASPGCAFLSLKKQTFSRNLYRSVFLGWSGCTPWGRAFLNDRSVRFNGHGKVKKIKPSHRK